MITDNIGYLIASLVIKISDITMGTHCKKPVIINKLSEDISYHTFCFLRGEACSNVMGANG
jgi:hypothetical protein